MSAMTVMAMLLAMKGLAQWRKQKARHGVMVIYRDLMIKMGY
jgi:hypothetical protein